MKTMANISDDTFVFEDGTYRSDGRNPIVLLFSRNVRTRERVIHEFRDFYPYFFIPHDETHLIFPDDPVRSTEGGFIDAFGRPITKVVVRMPNDVSRLRDRFSFSCESDVLFERRFLYDHHIKYAYKIIDGIPIPVDLQVPIQPRCLWIDIEVRSPAGVMPTPDKTEFPIVTIQVKDSYTKKVVILTHQVPQTDFPGHIATTSEVELLKVFHRLLERFQPSVLSGWYTEAFDMPYLVNRSILIGAGANTISLRGDAKAVALTPRDWMIKTTGYRHLDLLDVYKKVRTGTDGELDSYDLKTVSKKYGMPYKDYGAHIDHLISNGDYHTLLEYCKNDVEALENIENHTHIVEFMELLRMEAGTKIDDVNYNQRSIISLLHHDDIEPMPRLIRSGKKEEFEGATVLDPVPGLHERVGTVDMKALYPTIMEAFGLNPDVNGHFVRSMKRVVARREELRTLCNADPSNKMLKARQNVMKYIANSYYGVAGADTFPLHRVEVASKVTEWGRILNKVVKDKLIEYGMTVLYGDTDSLFFKDDANPLTPERLIKVEHDLNQYLHEKSVEWGALVDFTLKAEKLYDRIFFKYDSKGEEVAKKRYVGRLIWKEGETVSEINFVGIELRRSDQSIITKRTLERFLDLLFMQNDTEAAVRLVRTTYKDVRAGKVSALEVSIPKGLSSDRIDMWTRGVDYANKRFKHVFDLGTKVRMVVLRPTSKRDKEVRTVCIEEGLEWLDQIQHEVDWVTMADKTIKKKFISYLVSIGHDCEGVVNGQQKIF